MILERYKILTKPNPSITANTYNWGGGYLRDEAVTLQSREIRLDISSKLKV